MVSSQCFCVIDKDLRARIESTTFTTVDAKELISLIASKTVGKNPIWSLVGTEVGRCGGAKGGKATTEKKRAAAAATLVKARERLAQVRAAKKAQKQSVQPLTQQEEQVKPLK